MGCGAGQKFRGQIFTHRKSYSLESSHSPQFGLKREFIRHGLGQGKGKNREDRREEIVVCWEEREGEVNERELGKMRMGINRRGLE